MKITIFILAAMAAGFYFGCVYWEWCSRKEGTKAEEAKRMKCYCLGLQCNYVECPVFEQCQKYRIKRGGCDGFKQNL